MVFPAVYGLASHKQSPIAVLRNGVEWNDEFVQNAQEREIDEFLDFLAALYQCNLDRQQQDWFMRDVARTGVSRIKIVLRFRQAGEPWTVLGRSGGSLFGG